MNNKPPGSSILEALTSARQQAQTTNPHPFSPSAFAAMQDIIEGFIRDLIDESLRIARQHKAEIVFPNYVETASTYLVASRARKLFRHMGTVGGILLGGALSNVLAMAQNTSPMPKGATLISIAVGLVGAFLVAAHIVKD